MSTNISSRRKFLQSTVAGGSILGLGDLGFLSRLNPVTAEESHLPLEKVRLSSDVEPLVQLLEETPRETVLEEVARHIHRGTGYTDILAALLLAGVRNIEPRPSVGFKFHAVLVVNSAHLASLSSPDSDRWLPIFWAIDEFKSSQARDIQEGNWTMAPISESSVPTAEKSREAFIDAMQRWDEPAADAATAALARVHGANECFELFAKFGVRDFRSIGHKAIYVANSWRTLQCIGWRHAEPVLRSLAYALINHTDEPNPAESDLDADRPGRKNLERLTKIRDGWLNGKRDDSATQQLVALLRTGSDDAVCDQVVEMLNGGVSSQSIYDALMVGAGELLMRQPGIVALHAVTSTNAMRYIFEASANDETRRLVLLQNAAFLPLFREAMRRRGDVGTALIDELQPADVDSSSADLIGEIFNDVSSDPASASRKMLAYLRGGKSPQELIDAARRLVFLKGNDAHDYKFSSAVLEDYYHTSPGWRDLYLVTSVFKLNGSGERDNSLVTRIREAMG
ncbi:MAG: hypothetical protein KDA52_08740 [Planctomycetaceae bacterium]|nr:hypothetical protein [Planctomycetaceae bacterium]